MLKTPEDFGRIDRDTVAAGSGFQGNVWASEVVSWIAEWRVFVLRGEVLDVRQYAGHWSLPIHPDWIMAAVRVYKNAPVAYAMDVGRLDDGRWALVEVNDAYDLGTYGLEVEGYARMLSARWGELVGVEDMLREAD